MWEQLKYRPGDKFFLMTTLRGTSFHQPQVSEKEMRIRESKQFAPHCTDNEAKPLYFLPLLGDGQAYWLGTTVLIIGPLVLWLVHLIVSKLRTEAN